jgi:alpha-ribazole phosphatase
MKLTLVRHTSLQIEAGICYGQSDVAVSHLFETELAELKEKLQQYRFDAIYCSPLLRCQMLAESICLDPQLGLSNIELKADERLKELNFGDWELNAWDSIPREIFDAWADDYANLAPPNGETFNQLHARAKSFLDEMSGQLHGQHVLVITHGGLIRALIAEVMQIPLKRLFRLQIDYASLTQLEFDGTVPKIAFVNR